MGRRKRPRQPKAPGRVGVIHPPCSVIPQQVASQQRACFRFTKRKPNYKTSFQERKDETREECVPASPVASALPCGRGPRRFRQSELARGLGAKAERPND